MTKTEIEALLAKPTITPDELLQSGIFPLTRSGIYEAIKRKDLDVIEFGKKKAILTAPIRRKLGMEGAA
ncbi:hypothetical protein ACVWZ6_005589 [Bradyrhizobium sp. GM6.1]